MIITVTLNAALDKTLAVPNFRRGRRHRAVEQTASPGGKGVNVARALKALGQPVIATGVTGGPTGTRIIEQLTEEAILNDFVRIREESRTSTAVIDPTSGEQTEINERGPSVSSTELDLFTDKLLYLAKGASICVFSGSLPRGVEPNLYAELVEEVKKLGVLTVLDCEGESLRLAVRSCPTVVTPNDVEAEELVGHEFTDEHDRLVAVEQIVGLGPKEAIMTLGSGCVALVGDEPDRCFYRASLTQLEPVSTVGSGDAFLAGYLAARYGGRAAADCLGFAVACGAESTQHFGAGVLDAKAAERMLSDVSVEQLAESGQTAASLERLK
jgi:1-phosphofructokinase/tagatose 6-phosphate kinase